MARRPADESSSDVREEIVYRRPCRVTRQVAAQHVDGPVVAAAARYIPSSCQAPQIGNRRRPSVNVVVCLELRAVEQRTSLSHVLRSDTDMKMI